GLPGVGKTSLARAWARRRRSVHLRVDTVEQGLLRGGAAEVGAEGYAVAHAVAADQLQLGLGVVVDGVHPVAESRGAWRRTAEQAGGLCVGVELPRSDEAEHRRRGPHAAADLAGDQLQLGLGVVVDGVHPVAESREAWRRTAEQAGVLCVSVELTCSDEAEHRRRVAQRAADIEGHALPDWDRVKDLDRQPWADADLVLDTAGRDAESLADEVEAFTDSLLVEPDLVAHRAAAQ